MSENFELRQQAIEGIIKQIAMRNSSISNEQIARAKSMYKYDTRPLSEIESELNSYAEQITLREKSFPRDITEEKRLIHSPQQESRFIMVNEDETEILEEQRPIPEVMLEQPKFQEVTVQQHSYIPGLSLEQSDPTDELDAMFDNRQNITSDFDRVDSLGTNNKVLQKLPPKPQHNINNNESGYGTAVSFITIAGILSTIGIIMSFLAIVIK